MALAATGTSTTGDGDHAYIELVTAADHPMTGESSGGRSDRSWFGITEAVVLDEDGEPPRDEPAEFTAPLFEIEGAPGDRGELAARYGDAVRGGAEAWRDGSMTDAQAPLPGELRAPRPAAEQRGRRAGSASDR